MNRKPEKIECIYTVKRFGKPYRWIARPTIEKEKKYLGCFDSHDKAVEALHRFYERLAKSLETPIGKFSLSKGGSYGEAGTTSNPNGLRG